MIKRDSRERFSDRVEDYVRYRPGYPAEIIDFLQRQYALDTAKHIADIGAGTGISTAMFLQAGYGVTAVEPNKEMREKSVELLSKFPQFSAVDGTAEHTALEAASVDAIVCGQAFHWFDRDTTKAEFKRILSPDGLVILMWNERKTQSAFEQEYDQLIKDHAIDYVQVDHRNIDDQAIAAFYAPQPFRLELFPNSQTFDYAGLEGRLSSSSYIPARGQKGHAEMITALRALFDRYQMDNAITIHYDTKVYVGQL